MARFGASLCCCRHLTLTLTLTLTQAPRAPSTVPRRPTPSSSPIRAPRRSPLSAASAMAARPPCSTARPPTLTLTLHVDQAYPTPQLGVPNLRRVEAWRVLHTVIASVTYGYSLRHIRLQACPRAASGSPTSGGQRRHLQPRPKPNPTLTPNPYPLTLILAPNPNPNQGTPQAIHVH